MSWEFKVGKRYQITIRPLAPILDIQPGDTVVAELIEINNGKLVLKKKQKLKH